MIDQTGKLLGPTSGLGDGPAGAPPPRKRYVWLKVIGGLLVVALLYWVLRPTPPDPAKAQQGRHSSTGPVPVGAAVATQGDLHVTLTALGTVTPIATVTVHTQIAGLLQQLGFQEGQMVKQGDFLAQIDPRPYQAQLEQYEGQLAKDQAALADAQLDLKRYQTLVKQDSIATQTLDTQAATVHQDEGAVKVDQAQIDTAKLNLIYCHITAPVSGRVGLRQVDLGNYVQTSDTNGIVVITQLQPISVVFVLPEDNIEQVMASMKQGAHPQVTAFDRTNTIQLATGTLETIDNQIDSTTGTVKLRALFDNKDLSLFPQQFVNVNLLTSTLHNATIIPSSAVLHGAPGTFVYLVKPDNTVAVQVVKLGPVDGQDVGITEGLKPGDKVVVDGTDKLKDGAQITLPAEQKQGDGGDGKTAGEATNNTTDATNNATGTHHHGHHGNQTNAQ
jgi:multidrug efflux system membrane fusion protein